MTKAELYTFVTSLTGGIQIDADLFDTFLDVAQMQIEGLRPWVILRGIDTTQSLSAGDNWQNAKDLPSDFKEWCEETPVRLVDANYNVIDIAEIPFAKRLDYKTSSGVFCVDYSNNEFYVLGNLTQPYTIHQSYVKAAPLVSGDNTWTFPERFHKILALMVAVFWRKGIDYDIFNQTLADNQMQQINGILDIMTRWDSNLQQGMQRGLDPFNAYTIGGGNQSGGFVQY